MLLFAHPPPLPYCAQTNIELKSCVAREAETGRLRVYFFFSIKVNHVSCACVVVSRLVSDLGVQQNGEKKERKMSAMRACGWLNILMRGGSLRRSATCEVSMKCVEEN